MFGFGERKWEEIDYEMEHLANIETRATPNATTSEALFLGMRIHSDLTGIHVSAESKGKGGRWLPQIFIDFASYHTHYTKCHFQPPSLSVTGSGLEGHPMRENPLGWLYKSLILLADLSCGNCSSLWAILMAALSVTLQSTMSFLTWYTMALRALMPHKRSDVFLSFFGIMFAFGGVAIHSTLEVFVT